MIKRGNASKRAKAELFSNAAEYEKVKAVPKAQTGNIPRAQTGSIPRVQTGNIPKVQNGSVPRTQTGSIPRVQTGNIPKVQTGNIPRVQTGNIPRVQTGSIPRVQTGNIPRVQTGNVPRVQTGSVPRVQTGSIPRVQTGSVPRVRQAAPGDSSANAKTATYPRTGASGAQRRQTADTAKFAPVKGIRQGPCLAPTRTMDAVKRAVPAKKNKNAAKIAAACLALLLICGVLITVFALTGKKEKKEVTVVIPADAVAGAAEPEEAVVTPGGAADRPKVLRHNVKFTFYDKPEMICNTPEIKAGELMTALGIDYKNDKRLNIDEDAPINCDCDIDVRTVTHTVEYETEQIPYDTEYKDDSSMYEGEEEIATYGAEGVKTYTYDCTYVNGELESKVLTNEEVTSEPVTCVISRGTAVYTPETEPEPAPVQTVDNTPQTEYLGAPTEYLYYVDVRATCYYIVGTTATGLPTGHNVMAVDPNVIPLGSTCIVIGELGDYGVRIAADVGGGIKGNIIDLWVPEGTGFGWQNARVYVLSEG